MISFYLSHNWFFMILFVFLAFIAGLFVSMFIDFVFPNSKISYVSWQYKTKEGHRYTRGFFTILFPLIFLLIIGTDFYLTISKYNQSMERKNLIENNKFFEVTEYDATVSGVGYMDTINYFKMYNEKLINNQMDFDEGYFREYMKYVHKICGNWQECHLRMMKILDLLIVKYPQVSDVYDLFELKNKKLLAESKKRIEEFDKYQRELAEEQKNKPDTIEEAGKIAGEVYKGTKDAVKDVTKPVKNTINKFIDGFKKGSD